MVLAQDFCIRQVKVLYILSALTLHCRCRLSAGADLLASGHVDLRDPSQAGLHIYRPASAGILCMAVRPCLFKHSPFCISRSALDGSGRKAEVFASVLGGRPKFRHILEDPHHRPPHRPVQKVGWTIKVSTHPRRFVKPSSPSSNFKVN